MKAPVSIEDITIRTELKPGDMGYVIYLHGREYDKENQYGIGFESYVAGGFHEFYSQYDPGVDRVWICEHQQKIMGFLLLMHRPEQTAQLRFFLLLSSYRGIGLGKKLMKLYMEFLEEKGYRASYLWTTHEQEAAIALYEKNGFQLTKEKESEVFGKKLIERRYDLFIPGPVF